MFILRVVLCSDEEFDLQGLEALDRRRVLGLPDGVLLRTGSLDFCECEVPEWFARKHEQRFRSNTKVFAHVRVTELSACDIRQKETGSDLVYLDDALPPARLMELAEIAWRRQDAKQLREETESCDDD